jgi:hypothetical protein
MSSHLEKFVENHRDQFDDDAPAPELWDKIRERMASASEPKEEKTLAPVQSMSFKRWLSAAAAVVLLLAAGWAYYTLHRVAPSQPIAGGKGLASPETKQQLPVMPPVDSPAGTQPQIARTEPEGSRPLETVKPRRTLTPEEADYTEEMYHYARLVEIKHNELKTLQKDEPLLYKQFSGDVNKLDSVYQALKTQLPDNSNREQLIEAMISNLQLQIGLLNKQLNIIKQIKHSKKSAYEKAYQSI